MYESLPPKELARIKREGRIARVRRIRQFVASGAVSLVALFSVALLTRGLVEQTSATQPAVVARNLSTSQAQPASVTTPAPAPAPAPAPIVTSQS